MKLLSFGEVLWDVYPDNKYIGGAPLNFAAHFKKNGQKASMLSAVGNDELGNETKQVIASYGVDTRYIFTHPAKETGKCLVSLNEQLIPSYNLLSDVAYDAIDYPVLNEAFDVFYFGTLALRTTHNQTTVKRILENNTFKECFVDMNIRAPHYTKTTIEFALNHATILKISDEELPVVLKEMGMEVKPCLKEIVMDLINRFDQIKLMILTLGEKGSMVYHKEGQQFYECQAERVEVVSTVGAGDSFSATFLAQYLNDQSIESCLKIASRVSGFVVSKKDAIPDYQIEDFYERQA